MPSDSPPTSAPTTIAFQAFQARCDATSAGEGFVDCDRGFVRGDYGGQTCSEACGNDPSGNGGLCCTSGFDACGKLESDGTITSGFTGKGKQRDIHYTYYFGLVFLCCS